MYLTLKASNKNETTLKNVFRGLNYFVNTMLFEDEFPVVVENTVARIIANVFEEEGSQNQWEPLDISTQRERSRLGYDPEHPILVREGTYKGSFIDFDSPFYVTEHVETPTGYVHRIGTSNPIFPFHEQAVRIPVRAVTPIGDDCVFDMIIEDLKEFLEGVLKDARRGMPASAF